MTTTSRQAGSTVSRNAHPRLRLVASGGPRVNPYRAVWRPPTPGRPQGLAGAYRRFIRRLWEAA